MQRPGRSFEIWLRTAGLVFVVTALVCLLSGFYSRKFHLQTGPAAWIWLEHPLDEGTPIAFFAVRDVVVPPDPPFVRLRLACDAEWTLYLNGTEIAGGESAPDPVLHVLELSDVVKKGVSNRFAVALRSVNGVGGMLATVDYAPLRENDVVSDESWSICREWTPGVTSGETSCGERPLVLGRPPLGRWNYPEPVRSTAYTSGIVSGPVREPVTGAITRREIRVISGLAIESSTSVPATIFDLGVVEGRGRVSLPTAATAVSALEVRYVDDPSELSSPAHSETFVFAPGETTVTDPVPRSFRYVAVAADDAKVEVVRGSMQERPGP